MNSTEGEPDVQTSAKRPRQPVWLWLVPGIIAVVAAFNLTVWIPVAQALGDDNRNDGFGIHAYRTALIHPRDITLDLMSVDQVATIDLARGLFQSAAALKDREFGQITLARAGKPVFVMSGADFKTLGKSFAAGENPIYLVRTLPEKLSLPNGQEAFGTWSGGWLGVLNGQMQDVNSFGPAWVEGEPP
ncbi:hypothetical protein [Brevundimonas sp. TWP2-3-2]|uniref:hypothetical protein n=1 Tax=Brevundimonas sp. TWP2-3-2 TaxID=2804648 RepID=UPI003CEEC49E